MCTVKKKNAFTLAETLITLGIIGVVAALTIPTLINTYEKKVTVTRLKQTYSILNQAIMLSENVNGEMKYWDYTADVTGERFFNAYLKPYIKGAIKITKEQQLWKTLEGEIDTAGSSMYSKPRYKLPNGTFITVYNVQMPGTNLHNYVRTNAWIIVDINGYQGPNRSGRDVFFFGMYPYAQDAPKLTAGIHDQCGDGRFHYRQTREQLLHDGCATCKEDFTGKGYGCAALIQNDGWEIKDDYPW